MNGVLTGFAIVAVLIALGYLAARTGALPAEGESTLARFVFYLASPALLFTTLLEAPLETVFSRLLVGVAASSLVVAALYLLVSGLLWRRTLGERVIGALTASYVNAANLGIPISAYVLGDVSYVAPVLLFQLIVVAPVALLVLDLVSPTRTPGRSWLRPLANPIIWASLLGVALGAAGVSLPAAVLEPVRVLGGAAVPVALVVFGFSLRGSATAVRAGSGDVLLATTLKVVAHPLVAYALGRWVLGLEGTLLLAVTVLGALPAAQNVFVYAVRYQQAVPQARAVVLASTVLAVPAVLVATLVAT